CRPTSPRQLLGYIQDSLKGFRGPQLSICFETLSRKELRAEKHVYAAILRAGRNDIRAAMRSLEAALRLVPDYPTALYHMAMILIKKQKNYPEAIAVVRRLMNVIKSRPKSEYMNLSEASTRRLPYYAVKELDQL